MIVVTWVSTAGSCDTIGPLSSHVHSDEYHAGVSWSAPSDRLYVKDNQGVTIAEYKTWVSVQYKRVV